MQFHTHAVITDHQTDKEALSQALAQAGITAEVYALHMQRQASLLASLLADLPANQRRATRSTFDRWVKEGIAWRDDVRALANAYRANNPHEVGGVVMLIKGNVYGWKNQLRDPRSEVPGAVAVSSEGQIFVAAGGNDYDGAEYWALA
nr:hypothetical protein [uncultured Halomonas sp.]